MIKIGDIFVKKAIKVHGDKKETEEILLKKRY